MKLQASCWQHPGKEARIDSGERPPTTELIQKVEWRVVGIKVWYRVNIQTYTEPPSLLSNRPPLYVTSCGWSNFLPQTVSSHVARLVNAKNCSPGFVGRAK